MKTKALSTQLEDITLELLGLCSSVGMPLELYSQIFNQLDDYLTLINPEALDANKQLAARVTTFKNTVQQILSTSNHNADEQASLGEALRQAMHWQAIFIRTVKDQPKGDYRIYVGASRKYNDKLIAYFHDGTGYHAPADLVIHDNAVSAKRIEAVKAACRAIAQQIAPGQEWWAQENKEMSRPERLPTTSSPSVC